MDDPFREVTNWFIILIKTLDGPFEARCRQEAVNISETATTKRDFIDASLQLPSPFYSVHPSLVCSIPSIHSAEAAELNLPFEFYVNNPAPIPTVLPTPINPVTLAEMLDEINYPVIETQFLVEGFKYYLVAL